MYRISGQALSERPPIDVVDNTPPVQQFPITVVMNHRTGGLMKEWTLGVNDCPFEMVKFSEGERGCLDATIKVNKIDVPYYYGNEMLIYKNGIKQYRGFIQTIPEQPGDEISIAPYAKRLDEILYNTTYTDQTFKQIAGDVLGANDQESGVYYNDSLFRYDDETQYSAIYDYESMQKIIEDYADKVANSFWGVDANGFFYIKQRTTDVKKTLYVGESQPFKSIEVKKDYGKIKATRYYVYQKSTDNENVYINTIPDGTTYAYISLENDVGVKYEKWTAPEGIDSTSCEDLAYSKLYAQRIPQNIKVKGVMSTRVDVNIGDMVRIYDQTNLQLSSLIDCDTTSGWGGLISLSTQSTQVEGDSCLTFASSNSVYYDFGEIQRYLKIEKITFMVKSANVGNVNTVSFGNRIRGYSEGAYSKGVYSDNITLGLFTENLSLCNFRSGNVWSLVEVPMTTDFRYLGFRGSSTGAVSATIYLDDIRIYGYSQKMYEGTVIKKEWTFENKNVQTFDMELGDYEPRVNQRLFDVERKIAILETLAQE